LNKVEEHNLQNYRVHIGDSINVRENPACPGVHGGSKTIDCDLKGKYLGVATVESPSNIYIVICNIAYEEYIWIIE